MSRMIFTTKKKQTEPSLGKIVAALIVVLAIVFGGLRLWSGMGAASDMDGNVVAATVSPLDEARAKLEAGDLAAAESVLASTAASGTEGALLAAEIDAARGNKQAALSRLEAALAEAENSPRYPQAALQLARLYEDADRTADAEALYQKLHDSAPAEFRLAALTGLGRKEERAANPEKAREHFKTAVKGAKPNSEVWSEAVQGLGRTNIELIFATEPNADSKIYQVESGDTLTDIGIKLNTTQGLLTRANGIVDEARLNLGQRLKYTPKDFRIVIERSTCRLFLFDKDGLFKMYRTGLGMPGYETALGKYTIGNKQKDPTWFRQGGTPVPAGDPANELGTRWMPLVPTEENLPTDLGIHGTIAPETIGHYESHGCPRMLKQDVEELYDLVVRSTPVEIVEVIDWSGMSLG